MNNYRITDNVHPLKDEVKLGDMIHLKNQVQEVVECEVSKVKMLNIDADQLFPGDLAYIKKLGLTISNPETERPVALGEEYRTIGRKLADWLEDDEDDDDDSSFFSTTGSILGGGFLGSSSSGGFGSSFGGFGGGSFGGGGASRGF